MNFSNTIKFLRIKKEISQKELAEMLGVCVETVSRWETGRNRPSSQIILKRLIEILEIDLQKIDF